MPFSQLPSVQAAAAAPSNASVAAGTPQTQGKWMSVLKNRRMAGWPLLNWAALCHNLLEQSTFWLNRRQVVLEVNVFACIHKVPAKPSSFNSAREVWKKPGSTKTVNQLATLRALPVSYRAALSHSCNATPKRCAEHPRLLPSHARARNATPKPSLQLAMHWSKQLRGIC